VNRDTAARCPNASKSFEIPTVLSIFLTESEIWEDFCGSLLKKAERVRSLIFSRKHILHQIFSSWNLPLCFLPPPSKSKCPKYSETLHFHVHRLLWTIFYKLTLYFNASLSLTNAKQWETTSHVREAELSRNNNTALAAFPLEQHCEVFFHGKCYTLSRCKQRFGFLNSSLSLSLSLSCSLSRSLSRLGSTHLVWLYWTLQAQISG